MTAPDLIATLRPLWDELDRVQRLASEALAADDMQAWADHAARGAEIYERLAVLNGWRDNQ